MADTKHITIPAHLEPLAAQIREFSTSDLGDSLLLDYELSKRERHTIHSYIESFGLYSESIELKGSADKKIRIHRSGERKDLSEQNKPIDNEDVDCFAANVGAPYPCTDPDIVEYYNEAFNPMFDTQEKWALFLSERRNGAIRKEIVKTRETICKTIRASPNYQAFQKIRLRGQGNRIRGDVYHLGSVGKTFVSLDIKSANFTCIRMLCPDIFTDVENGDLMSWHDYVRTLTDSEFIAQSKIFREIVFGKLGFAKGSNVLQEAIMERVDQVLQAHPTLSKIFNTDTIRMKCGDENVYEINGMVPDEEDDNKHWRSIDLLLHSIMTGVLQTVMSEIKVADIPLWKEVFDTLGFDTEVELGNIFHVRIFMVGQIAAKKYFVKTFRYRSDWDCEFFHPDRCDKDEEANILVRAPVKIIHRERIALHKQIEFKRVDKKFYLQVLKYYQHLPIEENDLYFTDSGVKARYCYSIFE